MLAINGSVNQHASRTCKVRYFYNIFVGGIIFGAPCGARSERSRVQTQAWGHHHLLRGALWGAAICWAWFPCADMPLWPLPREGKVAFSHTGMQRRPKRESVWAGTRRRAKGDPAGRERGGAKKRPRLRRDAGSVDTQAGTRIAVHCQGNRGRTGAGAAGLHLVLGQVLQRDDLHALAGGVGRLHGLNRCHKGVGAGKRGHTGHAAADGLGAHLVAVAARALSVGRVDDEGDLAHTMSNPR